jgi:hypothetical protein
MLARSTIAFLLIALTGCGGNPQPQVTTVKDTVAKDQVQATQTMAQDPDISDFPELYLDAGGILVIFDDLEEFEAEQSQYSSDSLHYSLSLGPSPSSFSIRSASYRVIDVSQSFRTTMTVGCEGPHCELDDWKHYESSWTPLKLRRVDDVTRGRSYDPPDGAYERFPKYTQSELYSEVERHCGKDWAEGLRQSDSIAKTKDSVNFAIERSWYTSGPAISDYTYRITGIHSSTGDTVTKYIRLAFAMGC